MNISTSTTPDSVPDVRSGHDDPLVRVRDVCKEFGAAKVLDDVSLDFHKSEITVIIGRSGSGKSTLLRVVAGLTAADSGAMDFDGQRVFEDGVYTEQWSRAQSTIGMIFQSYTLWPHMNVLTNLTFAPRIVHKWGKKELRARAEQALDEVGMSGFSLAKPHQLSGGQRQRVAIARALMMRPRLLLCDEITSALDPPVAAEVLGVLSRLKRDEGISVALVTHDMAFAAKAADRLMFFDAGRIAFEGSPATGFSQTENAELRKFVEAVRF
ncbi:amino acid ABC transporter ATP-binding protein [Mycolicibacterium sp.]|uniref:amino acid ABC transporter ATP-binding protein n=1 Tax=Mycolicibacterium sp. TaxID=2320850 RepID=UPI0037CB9D48